MASWAHAERRVGWLFVAHAQEIEGQRDFVVSGSLILEHFN